MLQVCAIVGMMCLARRVRLIVFVDCLFVDVLFYCVVLLLCFYKLACVCFRCCSDFPVCFLHIQQNVSFVVQCCV